MIALGQAVLLLVAPLVGSVPPAAASAAQSGDAREVAGVLARVQARYGKSATLTARFTQTDAFSVGGGSVQRGTVTLKHPGRMRWDYASPSERLFVSDGREMWMWTPSTRQAVRYGAMDPRASSWVFDFLHRPQDAWQDLTVAAGPASPGALALVLTPKRADAAFTRVTLTFDADDMDLRSVVVVDAVGNTSTTEFSDLAVGIQFDDARFRFVPPKGAEVVDSR